MFVVLSAVWSHAKTQFGNIASFAGYDYFLSQFTTHEVCNELCCQGLHVMYLTSPCDELINIIALQCHAEDEILQPGATV